MQCTLEQRGEIPALGACITSFRTQAEGVSFLVNVLEDAFKRLCPEPDASQLAC